MQYGDMVERAAQAIYEELPYDGPKGTVKPEWQPHGNSDKQNEARRYAALAFQQVRIEISRQLDPSR